MSVLDPHPSYCFCGPDCPAFTTTTPISDALCDEIVECLLPRLRDRVPAVRVEAVRAIARLQDPEDAEDTVVIEFIRMLRSDSSKYVGGC